MPSKQIWKTRPHREVLPTPPPEIFHQQDLDTDPSQIWKSQQVYETEEREREGKKFTLQMADGEGAQDFFEDVPARKSVDKSGRARLPTLLRVWCPVVGSQC